MRAKSCPCCCSVVLAAAVLRSSSFLCPSLQVLSRKSEGCSLQPGQLEFSLVRDADAALTAGQWFVPGADGTFVGGRDELVAILSNSGRSVTVYDTAAVCKQQVGAKPLYSAEVKEGPVLALYPGPPAHIPTPPTPPPQKPAAAEGADGDAASNGSGVEDDAARQEWEQQEARRMELPRQLLLRTESNRWCCGQRW